MELIDGKKIAELIRAEIRTEVAALVDAGKPTPHLAAILVGDDPASQTYVSNKEKACKEVGIISSIYKLPENVNSKELFELIRFLNNDPEINGFIVQLPLPEHIDESEVIMAIDPRKDVDGFHPINVGRMTAGLPAYISATPMGIITLLERSGIETDGKSCVVLGRSNIVGTPVSILLSRKNKMGNATVTLCHSRTKDLEMYTRNADILIAAIGQPEFVKADMVKEGAVIIDVGIHRLPAPERPSGYRMVGDVKFDEVSARVSKISPVPGGVGPMTIVSLLQNTLKAFKKEIYK